MSSRWKDVRSISRRMKCVLALSVLGLAGSITIGASQLEAADNASHDPAMSLRRLTQEQYRQSIADIFGDDIKISARLELDPRREGLIAIGMSQAAVSAAGFEQYDAAAREIAEQVTDAAHRKLLIDCQPKDATQADDRCARQFLTHVGRLLYRRPLQSAEIARFTGVARMAATATKDFYSGIATSLATMLESPAFVFRAERYVWKDGGYRLDDYSIASRISFLIWNAPPDDALLLAAERGELSTDQGLGRQVDRLLSSNRFERGVRSFFSDMLALDVLDETQKDPIIYPRFSQKLAADAREQTLKVIVDTLVRGDADYRALYTTRKTFLSRPLGLLYALPVASVAGWERHEFAADDPRVGLLAQPAFLLAHAHPGRSSPTLRGKAIRELVLCQQVPAPPANVNFSIVQDTANPLFATARQRLIAHNTEPQCAGCHKLMDPLGLPLENFDGNASVRQMENGARIDAGGDHNGQAFAGTGGLGKVLADDPALGQCLVSRVYSYGAGRAVDDAASRWLDPLMERFATEGLRIRGIFRTIATSDAFYRPAESHDTMTVAARRASKNAKSTEMHDEL